MKTLLLSASLLLCLMSLTTRADVPADENGEISGTLSLAVTSADPGAFGYRANTPPGFAGSFRIRLNNPPAHGRVPDGDHEGTLLAFDLEIGDTMWNASMPHTPPMVRFVGGQAIGWNFVITETRPAHPDLVFAPPASPGIWTAIDDDGVMNNGAITGAYQLVPAEISVPVFGFWGAMVLIASLLILAFGVKTGAIR